MALSGSAALLRAHYRSTWNQIVRGAGFGGRVATGVMLAIIVLIVLLPGFFALRLGLAMGGELAKSADADVLRNWNGLQATFTVGFALLGSFRLEPLFPFTRFGRYPFTPWQLLLAELPASLFEVFPLLGVGATMLMGMGLAIQMPALSPFVFLLTLDGVAALMATMFILSALRAATLRRRTLLILLSVASTAAAFAFGLPELRVVLKEWLPKFVEALPLSRGYAGLLSLRKGDFGAGLRGIAIATIASVLLLLLAARLHRHRLTAEVESTGWRSSGDGALRFRTPASGLGRLFLRQLLASSAVRAQLVLPLLFTGTVALLTSLIRTAIAEGKTLSESMVALAGHAGSVQWFALVPVMAVAMNAQISLNQFGWDRGGIRTLLLLPLEQRDLLLGKLRGLSGFTALQTAIGILPLFTVRVPSIRETVIGLAAGGVTLIATTAVGQVVSIRFPRAVDGTAGLQVPLYLSWIGPVTLLITGAELAGIYALGEVIAKGGGIIALVLSLAGAVAAYAAILPRFAVLLQKNRERLLAM
ncbi:MAG TPA: hypothetical protein VHL58_15170 [Thermoanaerobaculia bacterium]|nr:hypothetical protein [Thermoanaerobaculia bacterium]